MKKPSIASKRKSLITRLITVKRGDYSRQIMYAKKLFDLFDHDFLLKFTPPHWFDGAEGSLQWFTTEDGLKWMKLKQAEFHFKVDNEIVEFHSELPDEKVDVPGKRSLRDFLN